MTKQETIKEQKEVTYEYGAMSSKFSLKAKQKLIAYASILIHYCEAPNLVVIYSPEECNKDSWTSFNEKEAGENLNKIWGSPEAMDKFIEENEPEIKECMGTIKKL